MKLYVPLVGFDVSDIDQGVCDFVLQGFQSKSDAQDLYPDAEIMEVNVATPTVEDNR